MASSLRQVNWWPGFWVFWYGSTTDQWEAAGGDPWELAARHWVEEVSAIECGAKAIPPDQLVSLRYEDFVADPVGRLAELVERISLPASADWLRSYGACRTPTRTSPGGSSSMPADAGHDRARPA